MALGKNSVVFEQEYTATDTAVVEKVTAAEPAISASTAIAKAAVSSGGALQTARNFKKEVEAMRGASDFSYGTHRVFKFDGGVLKEMSGEKLSLGRWAKVRLLAWEYSYQISPGENGKSSGGFVAYSRDGVTIDYVIGEENKKWEGKGVQDYLEYLRDTEGLTNASKREFIDTECAILDCEEEHDFHEVVQITLSSSSIPAFKKYQSELEAKAKCVAMGLPGYSLPEDPFQFYWLREAASKGSQSWTKGRIVTTLPTKI